MRTLSSLPAVLAIALPFAAPAADAPVEQPAGTPAEVPAVPLADERAVAWQAFRAAFDAGDYQAALPQAVRVVDQTASRFGPEAPEMVNALSNLATTYYRMGRHGEAIDTYRHVLLVLESTTGDPTDPRQVAPLYGLGSAMRALDRHDEAISPLKRAVDITRNRGGLHSAEQLPILKSLIDSYAKSGRLEEAGREVQYAYNIAETLYGRNDIRLLPALAERAGWFEQTGRYTAARLLHVRAVQIADIARPGHIAAVPALRGIARCFRLAHIFGESSDSVAAAATDIPGTLGAATLNYMMAASTVEGERALRNALQRLGSSPQYAAQRGAVLTDLGDWYATAGKVSRAIETWGDAWREFAFAGDTSQLGNPEPVTYRPPPASVARGSADPDSFEEQTVELQLAIDAKGDVAGVTVANPAPEREAAERAVIAALRRAQWRPAFRDGNAVAVGDFRFTERVFVKRQPG